jgi:hypothetical protein
MDTRARVPARQGRGSGKTPDMGFFQRKGAKAQRRKQMKEKPAAAKPPPSLGLRVSASWR